MSIYILNKICIKTKYIIIDTEILELNLVVKHLNADFIIYSVSL